MRPRPLPPLLFRNQPNLPLDDQRLATLPQTGRMQAVALLATLLLEASGAAASEGDDEHA
ncbi:MAG: hypothetical protein JOY65_03600 [Acetobacteraceae bacterium]|nr:hypothetical protein [Acetobacteraceae bacterium]